MENSTTNILAYFIPQHSEEKVAIKSQKGKEHRKLSPAQIQISQLYLKIKDQVKMNRDAREKCHELKSNDTSIESLERLCEAEEKILDADIKINRLYSELFSKIKDLTS